MRSRFPVQPYFYQVLREAVKRRHVWLQWWRRGILKERLMGRERDPRQFEKGREVQKERTRNTSEKTSEEDRRQWVKTRDISKEASEIPEDAQEQDRRVRKEEER